MDFFSSIFDQAKQGAFEYLSSGHALLLDTLLQAYFFMEAIVSVIIWGLEKTNLFFKNSFKRSNGKIKIIIFVLFLYVQVWDTFSAYFQILAYFCSASICIKLYSLCVRWGVYFCHLSKGNFGHISSFLTILVIFICYKIFNLSQIINEKETKYAYISFYFLAFGSILVISAIRKKQIIYCLVLMSMTGLIILVRHYWDIILKDTFLSKTNIPLESIVYGLLAVQQNYLLNDEQKKLKRLRGDQQQEDQGKTKPCELFKAQVYYFIYFLVKKRMYPIELVFSSICLFSYLFGKPAI